VTIEARLEWGIPGVEAHAATAGVVVIVDVLSFSTSVSIAVERDAGVVPHPLRDASAAERAAALGAVLANPSRRGPGPTLSPQSLTTLPPGSLLVLPSPNGATCSVIAADAGALVIAGCLRNAKAVGAAAAATGGAALVVPAGERWPDGSMRPAVEDLVGAGAILAGLGEAILSPEAHAAVAAFREAEGDLLGRLRASVSGRELIDAGFEGDLDLAAELDATTIVPVLRDGAFRA